MAKISYNNKKLTTAVPSYSLPPVICCHNCAGCAKKCYAKRMAARRPSVAAAWAYNLDEWKTAPEKTENSILAAGLTSQYFRYFVGGDIPDKAFFEMMIRIARKAKNCRFLCFTKYYELVNSYLNDGGKIPRNLQVIFSVWDREIPNPHNLPTSRVLFKGDAAPKNGKLCGGNCADCAIAGCGCWTLKKGESIYFNEH